MFQNLSLFIRCHEHSQNYLLTYFALLKIKFGVSCYPFLLMSLNDDITMNQKGVKLRIFCHKFCFFINSINISVIVYSCVLHLLTLKQSLLVIVLLTSATYDISNVLELCLVSRNIDPNKIYLKKKKMKLVNEHKLL